MLCPVCKIDRLVVSGGSYLDCPGCGLHRRPSDKILMREETNFYVLNRNVKRTPKGTEVEIMEANPGLRGIHGQSRAEGPTYALRSRLGFIIGLSRDKDDLILLTAECGWRIEDTEITSIINGMNHDNTT